MVLLIKNNKELYYLDIWKQVFTNSKLKSKCKNVLHLFKILFVMPFSKTKLDRMFLQMLRVKSDWCNRLTRDHLESLLQINKDEESLKMFNSEPLRNHWLNDKSTDWQLPHTEAQQ